MTDPKVKEVPAVDKVKEETAAPAPEAAAATSSKRKETPPVKGEDDDGDKDDGRPKREKRARKSADVFAPDNFRAAEKQSKIPDGRGTALGDFPEVRASVEAAQLHSAAVVSTYRLLVGRKPGKKDRTVKATILSFRGFLLIKPPQTDDEKQLALDEAAETRMSVRVYKMTIQEIKNICDLCVVDRFKKSDKDALVDCLLDFLGKPNAGGLKGHAKKKSTSSKTKAKTTSASAAKDDDDSESEAEQSDEEDATDEDGMPTDEALRKWVRAYVRCFNLKKATIKHALATASDKFGVDVGPKKAVLKTLLTNEM